MENVAESNSNQENMEVVGDSNSNQKPENAKEDNVKKNATTVGEEEGKKKCLIY